MPGQPSGGDATCAHSRRRPTGTTYETPTYYQGHRYHFFFIFFLKKFLFICLTNLMYLITACIYTAIEMEQSEYRIRLCLYLAISADRSIIQ